MNKTENRIIFPLDLPTLEEALKFTTLLKDRVGVFKIGLELFVAEGPGAVRAVKKGAPGARIFLDMKFHDCAALALPRATADKALSILHSLEKQQDIKALMAAAPIYMAFRVARLLNRLFVTGPSTLFHSKRSNLFY